MGSRSILETLTAADQEASRLSLQRILVSRTFSKALRLCSLLQYIVENSLSGEFDNLTEQQIGIQVFNRSPGYNSGEDNIVRGTARHLRHRLEQYYIDEGKTERLHISIPKGGYVDHFEISDDWVERAPEPTGGVSQSELVTHTDIQSASTSWPFSARAAVSLLTMLAILLPLVVYFLLRPSLPIKTSHQPQTLWSMLFTPERKTMIVPGDASLDTYIALGTAFCLSGGIFQPELPTKRDGKPSSNRTGCSTQQSLSHADGRSTPRL